MVKNFEKMAALGALGVCGGVVATYLVLAWLAKNTPVAAAPGATGGIDNITRNVVWIAALVPVLIFLWSHLAFVKQLRGGPSSLND
jgi:hypothetical protein